MKARIFSLERKENGEGQVGILIDVPDIESWKKLWVKSDEIGIEVNLSREVESKKDEED
jgi:hypothetical protein